MAMKRTVVRRAWDKSGAHEVVSPDVRFPDANQAAKDVDAMEDFVGLNPPLDVLEIASGIGPYAIEFAKRGYRVVAIDVARQLLDQAERAANDASVVVEFRLQSATELPEKGHFDFILAHWHTIGFMTDEQRKRHFASVYSALKPGCSFLYVFQGARTVPGKKGETVAPIRNWTEKDGKFILSERAVRDGIPEEYSIVIDTETAEITEYREQKSALGYKDVLDHLKAVGFASVRGYKDFAKTPATPEEFSIFVCQK